MYDLCIKKGTIVNDDHKLKANIYVNHLIDF